MVQFGVRLATECRSEWSNYCVDYESLKLHIGSITDIAQHSQSDLAQVTRSFLIRVDQETEKSATFYESTLRGYVETFLALKRLANAASPAIELGLSPARQQHAVDGFPHGSLPSELTPSTFTRSYITLRDVLLGLCDCVKFAELNSQAVRKVLKKAEKSIRRVKTKATETGGETLLDIFVKERLYQSAPPSPPIGPKADIKLPLLGSGKSASALARLQLDPGLERLQCEVKELVATLRHRETQWVNCGALAPEDMRKMHGTSLLARGGPLTLFSHHEGHDMTLTRHGPLATMASHGHSFFQGIGVIASPDRKLSVQDTEKDLAPSDVSVTASDLPPVNVSSTDRRSIHDFHASPIQSPGLVSGSRDLKVRGSLGDISAIPLLPERRPTNELIQALDRRSTRLKEGNRWFSSLASQAFIDFEKAPVGAGDKYGLFINHYNTFLYMLNYTIPIPSSSKYAEVLNLSPIMSGALLAMTPMAALASSVVYSAWSSRSFRRPLLVASVLLIVGNICHVAALPLRSPGILFVGRCLIGLGGTRAVNRRYVADFVEMQDRVFHSSLFVAVGSLGMAFGPALDILFEKLHIYVFTSAVSDKTPHRYRGDINPLTAPGWLCLLLWLVFLAQICMQFKEPKRYPEIVEVPSLIEPLLAQDGDMQPPKSESASAFLFSEELRGVVICLWVYFVLKLAQEAFSSAAPLVTSWLFDWNGAQVGSFLGVLGLLVFPLNVLIGLFSKQEERHLQTVALIILTLGCLSTVCFSLTEAESGEIAGRGQGVVSLWRYIIGGGVLFFSAQILEGINMSLLSKVTPKRLTRGLFNSGLLSTEAGTLGRVVGNATISLIGSTAMNGVAGVRRIALFIPSISFVLCVISLLLTIPSYDYLRPIAERLIHKRRRSEDNTLGSPVGCEVTPADTHVEQTQYHRLVDRRK